MSSGRPIAKPPTDGELEWSLEMKSVKFLIFGLLAFSLTACTEANIEKVNSKPSPSASAASETKTEAITEPEVEKEKESETPPPSKTETYQVGDSVKFDDLVITVNGIRESDGGDFLAPGEGNVYLLVDVTAENTGDEEAALSSMMQTEVVDSEGFSYNVTIVLDAKGSFDGSVGAGRKLRGEIAYEVPKDASLEFIFSDPFKSGQAIWKLK
jgi:hypothetical protein